MSWLVTAGIIALIVCVMSDNMSLRSATLYLTLTFLYLVLELLGFWLFMSLLKRCY